MLTHMLEARNAGRRTDRKSTRLNSSHLVISYAVFCLKKKKNYKRSLTPQCSSVKQSGIATKHLKDTSPIFSVVLMEVEALAMLLARTHVVLLVHDTAS